MTIPSWSSAILMDFNTFSKPISAFEESDEEDEEPSDEEGPSIGGGTTNAIVKAKPQDLIAEAEAVWEQTRQNFGEVDLENFFHNCASHVLEHMILRIVDETISGRYNWSKLNMDEK